MFHSSLDPVSSSSPILSLATMHHRVCTHMYIHWHLLFLFTESLATGYLTSFAWWSTLHVAPPHLLHLLHFFLADLSTGLLASSAGSLASLHESIALRSWQSSSPATQCHLQGMMVVAGGTSAGVLSPVTESLARLSV